jgi:uncharacterized damage-inducible protein DinB
MSGMPAIPRANVFLDRQDDPRENGTSLGDEKETLVEFLRCQRLTMQIKCEGLDAGQLARRSVEPSTMSLLGLVRHMAEVERNWFRRVLAAEPAPRLYITTEEADRDWDGAVPDPAVVDEAWASWRSEVANAEAFVRNADDLGMVAVRPRDGLRISLREVLLHMVEEYARHNGHADLLRERIDGRLGQ